MDLSPVSFRPDGLRQSRLFESPDLDIARAKISAVMQPHALRRRPGPHRGSSYMDFVRIAGMGIGSIRFGEPVEVDPGRIADYHLLMFCTEGRADVRVDGLRLAVNDRRGMVCAPGRPFTADLSGDCEQFVLRIDEQAVYGHTGIDSFRFERNLDLARPELQGWVHQMRALATSRSLIECAQQKPALALELERLALMLLIHGHADSRAAAPARGAAPAPRTVRLAESFIEANVGAALRLDDIAAAAGVPVRTLLDGFKRFRDHTPIQYLHAARLNRSREVLRHAAPGTRVAEVAMDHGFLHLGRFAAAYRKRFGESPSDTLRRAS